MRLMTGPSARSELAAAAVVDAIWNQAPPTVSCELLNRWLNGDAARRRRRREGEERKQNKRVVSVCTVF